MSDIKTDQQLRFAQEYIIDLNATQAAIRAGYSAKTASEQASRLLGKVKVQDEIARLKQERSERTQIDADWVLSRLAAEVEADMADLVDETTGSLRAVKDWPLIWRKGLVSGFDVAEISEDGKSVGELKKIKLSDRIRRLELIGKHVAVGAFSEKHEHTGKDGEKLEFGSDRDFARAVAFYLTKGVKESTTNNEGESS